MKNYVFQVHKTSPGLLLSEEGDGLTFRKELIYENAPGESFKKKTADVEQEFTIDVDKLDHWEEVGNTMIENGIKIPVPLKHTDDPESNRGNVIRFERDINEEGREALFGVIKFRDKKAAELAKSTDVSIFVPDKPIYDGLGNKYVYPIRHVCCTDYPVIPKLGEFQPIAASMEILELTFNPIAKFKETWNAAKAYRDSKEASRAEYEKAKVPNRFAKKESGPIFGGMNPVTYVKKKANRTARAMRKTVQRELNHAAKGVVRTAHKEVQRAVQQEIDALKSRIKGAPSAAMNHVANKAKAFVAPIRRNPVLAAVIGAGAIGAHYGTHKAFEKAESFFHKKPKIEASLELSRRSKKPKVEKPLTKGQKAAETRRVNAVMKRAKLPHQPKPVFPLSKNGKRVRNLAGALFATAVGTAVYKHLTTPTDQHSLSLSDEMSQPRSQKGRFVKDPNSKASQREARRQLRAREAQSNRSLDPNTNTPSLRKALDSAAHNLHDFYHADKSELAGPSNAFHSAKHLGVSAIHAGVVAGASYIAAKQGVKAYKAFRAADPRAQTYFKRAIAGLGAAGGSSIGMYDHAEAAAQHYRALRNKLKK
jgi:hypothetical protein